MDIPPEIPVRNVYFTLQEKVQEVRLLSIAPGTADDDIHSSLITVSLNDKLNYETLSYTWGDPAITSPIMLDGRPFHVTRNLEKALRRMRLTDTARVIWVDAICINQNDVAERNSQVQLMSRIYSGCARGLIWLGEEDDETEGAFRLIRLWSDDVHYKEWATFKSDVAAVGHIIQRAWWSRIWTVQETLLPPENVVCCGRYSLTWSQFIQAKDSLEQHKIMTCCQGSYAPNGETGKVLGQFLRAVHFLKAGASLIASGKRSFLANAMLFCGRQASDPRDKIFALLGLIPAREREIISVHYDADVLQVYREFTVNHIRYHGLLDILSLILDNPSTVNLPSWVWDWTPPIHNFELHMYRVMRLTLFNACSNLKANIATYRLGEEFVLKENGICFDSVSYVEDELTMSTWAGVMKRWYNFAELTLGNLYITGESFDDAFWRMAMLDTMLVLMTLETDMARVTARDIKLCKRWAERIYKERFVSAWTWTWQRQR